MPTKRQATPDEVSEELQDHASRFNICNPSFEKPDLYWTEMLAEAESQGYQNEVCSCGCVFLALHHYTRCSENGCPFSDGVSLLDRFAGVRLEIVWD